MLLTTTQNIRFVPWIPANMPTRQTYSRHLAAQP
jgi:hypothetical protein